MAHREIIARALMDGVGKNLDTLPEDGRDSVLRYADAILSDLDKRGACIEEGWRDMESAPKDGTEIDLWLSIGVRVADCRWGKPSRANWGDRYGCDQELPEGWITRSGCALDRRSGQPTHWRPMPAAPK